MNEVFNGVPTAQALAAILPGIFLLGLGLLLMFAVGVEVPKRAPALISTRRYEGVVALGAEQPRRIEGLDVRLASRAPPPLHSRQRPGLLRV